MVAAIAVILIFSACGPNARIKKSWKDPETAVDFKQLNKVLVVAFLKDETHRRVTEDKIVSMLSGKGIASYTTLNESLKKENEEKIKAQVKGQNFDGILMLRLVDVEKDVQYTPGTYNTYPTMYRSFWPYYWNSFNTFYTPGHYSTTKVYSVETSVFSFPKDKLVYSALTTSSNPENVEKLMEDVSKVVFKEMVKEGFVTNTPNAK